jgi:pSer/pThr/pTyr-binding forkhead associated (FHA) protein
VEVRWGRLAGTKAIIAPGGTLRVGRTERADLVIGHDGKMSHVHFELQWEGGRCLLRDLGSIEGTKLGGTPVTNAEVPHGGWIQAGETDLAVYVEDRTVRVEDEDDAPDNAEQLRLEAAEEVIGVLRNEARKEPLYAVLDAARDDRILELLREHVEPHRSLYEGAEGETLEEVAPYLVGPIQEDSALLERLVREGWGKRWGIYCTSREPFREVRRHWRRFLMVELDESRERVYFRFYDPAVMVTFMDTADEEQRSSVNAIFTSLLAEDETNDFDVWRAPRGLS